MFRQITRPVLNKFVKSKVSGKDYVMSSNENSIDRAKEIRFLQETYQLLSSRVQSNNTGKVIDFKNPDELSKLIDFGLPQHGQSNETLLDLCKSALDMSLNVNHPMFMNQLYAKPDPYGVAADAVASSVSTNLHTFEVAPVFVMAERAVLMRSLERFGFPSGEGTFCPGGSYSNMLGLNLSKFKKYPMIKETGMIGMPRVALFCSKQAHYSLRKNAVLLGFGTDCIVTIDCDETGKMKSGDLEKKVTEVKSQGIIPLFVNTTAGTTVMGAFDPFDEIAEICNRHDIWMHVDGAYGASVIFSKTYEHLCKGVDKADSVAWNPHKMLSAPIQCSVFLSKHSGMMSKYHSFHVPYLFQQDKPYDTAYDIGTNLIQCGRRVDSFKFWLMWKARGDNGFEEMVDRAFNNTKYFTSELIKRENFELVTENTEFTNVPFWFVPNSLKGCEKNELYWKTLHEVAPKIKGKLQADGSLMIGYQPLEDKVNFFRLVIINKDLCHADMDHILDEFERVGADL